MTKNTSILFPHTAIYTPSLSASMAFYRILFDAEPVKVKPGYAKFELHTPKWNFTLNEITLSGNRPEAKSSPLSHLGFQVASTQDVATKRAEYEKKGIAIAFDESNTTCCYAVQDKFWVQSPEGIMWEVFAVLSDADVFNDAVPAQETPSVCCAPTAAAPVQLSLTFTPSSQSEPTS